MPTWSEVGSLIERSLEERGELGPDLDGIRRRFLHELHDQTKNAVIVYASGWLHARFDDVESSVNANDVTAFMETCKGVGEKKLDLVLHSPGGSASAAEQVVNYLRTRFDYIRVFVPLQAKSAATMIALGCDEIVLGAHSELGPTDPQIPVPTPAGGFRYAPAHAILGDFKMAKRELSGDVTAMPAWTPILSSYAGGLLTYCDQQIKLSQDVVADWLSKYMLAHEDAGIPAGERPECARTIAEWFSSEKAYDRFRDHARPIRIEELKALPGLRVQSLEADHDLQDKVLSISHILDFTFRTGMVFKVVENHNDRTYLIARSFAAQ